MGVNVQSLGCDPWEVLNVALFKGSVSQLGRGVSCVV